MQSGSLANKTIFITGASRGIGRAIALKCAQEGASIVIASKTTKAHEKLPGTIYTVAAEIEKKGARCLPVAMDLRSEDQIMNAVSAAVAKFSGIDVLVNNAGAIDLSSTADISSKRYHLLMDINSKGPFLCIKHCLPYLKQAANPHILNICPPLSRISDQKYFATGLPYTISKFCMTLYTYGMAKELQTNCIAVNSLWPRKPVWTAALYNLASPEQYKERCRDASIMGDAALAVITKDSNIFTGNFLEDEEILEKENVTDFTKYNLTEPSKL